MSEMGDMQDRPQLDAIDIGVEYLKGRPDVSSYDPTAIVDTSLVIQSSGIELPFAAEKIAAFKAAQAARDIVDLQDVSPEDFNS